jgi:peroxiredoxin
LQKDVKELDDAGIQVVAVSYDSTEILKRFAKQGKIKFPLLSDKDSEVIKAFGVLNKEGRRRTAGVPHPGTFVIDSEGVIRAKLPGTVRVRHTTDALLKASKSIK